MTEAISTTPADWRCRHHLAVEVTPLARGGTTLTLSHGHVTELAETCSLDVADRGSQTLEDVGAALSITKERVRQIETHALSIAKRRVKGSPLDWFGDDGVGAVVGGES